MKKALLLCALSLAVFPILAACGGESAPPAETAPVKTEAPAEAGAAIAPANPLHETDAEEAAPVQTPDPLYAPYRELVNQIAQGLARGWASDLVTEIGISEVFKTAEKDSYGWLQADINRDGVDELLFGRIVPEGEASPFYDIYTILGAERIHLSTGWDYNHWYLLSDGLFVNEWHGAGNDSYRTAYGLFNGKLIPANRYVERSEYIHLDFHLFEESAD